MSNISEYFILNRKSWIEIEAWYKISIDRTTGLYNAGLIERGQGCPVYEDRDAFVTQVATLRLDT